MVQKNIRIQREKAFQDERYSDKNLQQKRTKKVSRFYQLTKSIHQEYKQFIFQNSKNVKTVEIGCGVGSYAIDLAQNGADTVTAIDISTIAIDIASSKAKKKGVDHNLFFEVMNAEDLTFNSSSVDLICGGAILHHLDIEKTMQSMTKILQANGKAIFIEPLGHNILINFFRNLTPAIRSEDEHPLLDTDLELFQKYFKKVEIKYFYLTALAASLFAGSPGFDFVLSKLEFLDRQLFKLPFLQKQAWQVLIRLSEPIK
ncbi:class I SAM-dependent methyltransferase [Mastigocoleus sp. MO_188.B34]|uniref:class I SAM-dependent methyltransferase n=1 Tax=Mastigocoleus sp. MO_188.B34 TaxID=3036635 RepID=UPI00262D02E7|nr:class I SAM-dependent methyltransferase [Mastigocoleus sp. MO_188.B34]MDJ0696054.1 class I SAM-dependent methyltransferase [Mastigocoleus sp. MO_188.B34]